MSYELTDYDKAIIRERRREFWGWTWRVAIGVFLGNMAALATFLVALDEGWLDWVIS